MKSGTLFFPATDGQGAAQLEQAPRSTGINCSSSMAAAIRSLGERLLAWGTPTEGSEARDDEIELQVHEKEDVELDVLDLKGRDAADGGHIIDLAASSDSVSQHRGLEGLPGSSGDFSRSSLTAPSDLSLCASPSQVWLLCSSQQQAQKDGRSRTFASWMHSQLAQPRRRARQRPRQRRPGGRWCRACQPAWQRSSRGRRPCMRAPPGAARPATWNALCCCWKQRASRAALAAPWVSSKGGQSAGTGQKAAMQQAWTLQQRGAGCAQ